MTVKLFHVACSCAPPGKRSRLRYSSGPTTNRGSALFFKQSRVCLRKQPNDHSALCYHGRPLDGGGGRIKPGRIEWHTEMFEKPWKNTGWPRNAVYFVVDKYSRVLLQTHFNSPHCFIHGIKFASYWFDHIFCYRVVKTWLFPFYQLLFTWSTFNGTI